MALSDLGSEEGVTGLVINWMVVKGVASGGGRA